MPGGARLMRMLWAAPKLDGLKRVALGGGALHSHFLSR